VAWRGRQAAFPHGAALRAFGQVLPEQAETLHMLAAGRRVVAIAPASTFVVLALADAPAAALTVLHPLPSFMVLLRASLEAGAASAGRRTPPQRTDLRHLPTHAPGGGAEGGGSGGALTFQDYFRHRDEDAAPATGGGGIDAAGEAVRAAVAGGAPALIVMLEQTSAAMAAAAVAEGCSGARDCVLWIGVQYDGEGAVLSERGLEVLEVLRQRAGAAGHVCFWHMADWHRELAEAPAKFDAPSFLPNSNGDGGGARARVGEQLQHVAPHLDVVCLPEKLAAVAPASTRIDWAADLNAQVKGLLQAFNPSFFHRHTFYPGAILPAICSRKFPLLCRGPGAVKPFRPTEVSARGRLLTAGERAASAAWTAALMALQFPAKTKNEEGAGGGGAGGGGGGACGARDLLVFCYIHAHIHMHMHAYIYISIHIYTHTHIHTHRFSATRTGG
jgi:hypothetical protein